MSSRKKLWLVLSLGLSIFSGVPYTPLSAKMTGDSVKLAPDSTRTRADSAKSDFPSSYDPKVLKKIEKASHADFVDPIVTEIHLDTAATNGKSLEGGFAWLQVKIRDDRTVRDAKIVYCSAPGEGFEQAALDSVRSRQFSTFVGEETWKWLWHEVFFPGKKVASPADSSTYGKDDKLVPIEVSPEMTFMETPLYPLGARVNWKSGVVWIKALVDHNGKVRQAMVGTSCGEASLDQAAVQAAYKNRFFPAFQNGRAVAVWVTYKVQFKLNE